MQKESIFSHLKLNFFNIFSKNKLFFPFIIDKKINKIEKSKEKWKETNSSRLVSRILRRRRKNKKGKEKGISCKEKKEQKKKRGNNMESSKWNEM